MATSMFSEASSAFLSLVTALTTEGPVDHDDDQMPSGPLVLVTTVLTKYLPMAFVAEGILTNILSLVPLTRMSLKNQSTTLYLFCLALADTTCVIFLCVEFWKLKEPYCHITGMLLTSSSTWSALLVLAVTTERFIAVWFPLKAGVWLLKKHANVFVATIAAASYTMYIPRVFFVSDEHHCDPRQGYSKIYFMQIMIFCSLGPIFLTAILNSAIIARLRMKGSMLQHLSQQATSSSEIRKLTLVVVMLSMTYTIFMLPFSLTSVYMAFTKQPVFKDPEVQKLWMAVVNILSLMNHCVNFWLYCLVSSRFRKGLKERLMCFYKPNKQHANEIKRKAIHHPGGTVVSEKTWKS